MRPYAQIGFMPKDLSIKPEPYQHHWTPQAKYDEIYTGWAYPPKDYASGRELVFQWTKHCVEKYGRAEVETWYWETWNEPNIGYWRGTPEEFRKLHDYAIDAVRRALPTASVGGADTRRQRRQVHARLPRALPPRHQLRHRQDRHADRLRLVPRQGRARVTSMATSAWASRTSSATIDDGFRIVASYPELKDKPIVIGESDPEGCAACQGPQLGYRNGTMYSSYTAASFARKHDLADQARRQPRRRADVGVRVRGPALLRRASARSRPTASTSRCSTSSACSAKMSGQARRRRAATARCRSTRSCKQRRARPARRRRAGEPRQATAVRPGLALPRRRRARPGGRRRAR